MSRLPAGLRQVAPRSVTLRIRCCWYGADRRDTSGKSRRGSSSFARSPPRDGPRPGRIDAIFGEELVAHCPSALLTVPPRGRYIRRWGSPTTGRAHLGVQRSQPQIPSDRASTRFPRRIEIERSGYRWARRCRSWGVCRLAPAHRIRGLESLRHAEQASRDEPDQSDGPVALGISVRSL